MSPSPTSPIFARPSADVLGERQTDHTDAEFADPVSLSDRFDSDPSQSFQSQLSGSTIFSKSESQCSSLSTIEGCANDLLDLDLSSSDGEEYYPAESALENFELPSKYVNTTYDFDEVYSSLPDDLCPCFLEPQSHMCLSCNLQDIWRMCSRLSARRVVA